MAKPRKYGMFTTHLPNARADMRFRKKVYQRGREYTDKHEAVLQDVRERRERKQLERMKGRWLT